MHTCHGPNYSMMRSSHVKAHVSHKIDLLRPASIGRRVTHPIGVGSQSTSCLEASVSGPHRNTTQRDKSIQDDQKDIVRSPKFGRANIPLDAARRKAREAIDQIPQNGLTSIVENWRQLPNGRVEFAIRRLPTAD